MVGDVGGFGMVGGCCKVWVSWGMSDRGLWVWLGMLEGLGIHDVLCCHMDE